MNEIYLLCFILVIRVYGYHYILHTTYLSLLLLLFVIKGACHGASYLQQAITAITDVGNRAKNAVEKGFEAMLKVTGKSTGLRMPCAHTCYDYTMINNNTELFLLHFHSLSIACVAGAGASQVI